MVNAFRMGSMDEIEWVTDMQISPNLVQSATFSVDRIESYNLNTFDFPVERPAVLQSRFPEASHFAVLASLVSDES